MTPSSSSEQSFKKDQASMTIIRGRDKRRHLSASAIDLRDPYELISLAIRFDESRENEAILRVPLERGSLYDNNHFIEALEFLRERTKPSLTISKQSPVLEKNQFGAITPIILSGVLSTMQQQRELSDKDPYSMNTSSELVNACQTMRNAALSRLRMKKKRGRRQRVIIPSFCVLVLIIVYIQSLLEMQELVIKMGFLDSCNAASLNVVDGNSTKDYYEKVCRISEASLWSQYKAYMLMLDGSCDVEHGDCLHQMLDGYYREAPFSMHTTLSRSLITLEDLELSTFSSFLAQMNRHSEKLYKKNEQGGVSWLGDTTVNRLVGQVIREYLPANQDLNVLDVGCSVGGTLYPLISSHRLTTERNQSFRYHGISLSGTEIEFARRLAVYHDIPSDLAFFEQSNFDTPLSPSTYSAIMAIETLSYSPHIEKTLSNLIKSLKVGGIFIIVDEVVVPGQQESINDLDLQSQASLFSHTFWIAAFDAVGCKLEIARDLSLEYEVLAKPKFQSLAFYWQYRIASLWASKFSATRRVVTLAADLFAVSGKMARREEAFRRAELGYNIYVCRKL